METDADVASMRALKTVALADGVFHDLERQLLTSVQEHVTKTDLDLDELETISPEELAAATPPDTRGQVLDRCVVVAMIDGDASWQEIAVMERFAQALKVKSRSVEDLSRLVHHHNQLFRADVMRRSFIGQRVRDYLGKRGLGGVVQVARGLLHRPHAETAARYHALAELPDGTLGREFFRFTRDNEFSFPGEPDGPPEPIVFHDCLHVLGEYGTAPTEETQVAAFQSGMLTQDSIFGLMFVLAQFQMGVMISPVNEGYRMACDPDLLLRGYLRGRKVNKNLCTDWEPWDDFERPVAELREAYNIVPRDEAP